MVFMRLRDRESIQEAVRRFRKIVERSGLKREMRRREYYDCTLGDRCYRT
jgi:small subunit ribosomal protein S21